MTCTSKFVSVVLLGAASASSLLAAGCSSAGENQPYSLTGNSQAPVDPQHQEWLRRQQYTDQKGRYHPGWDPASRVGYAIAE